MAKRVTRSASSGPGRPAPAGPRLDRVGLGGARRVWPCLDRAASLGRAFGHDQQTSASPAHRMHTLHVQGDSMSRYVAPACLKRTRSYSRFVLGGLILALVWASSIGAQEPPILRVEGRVTHVSPREMLVALDSGGVVMLDLARIPQGEIRQIAQNDYVAVIGFIRRPSHRLIATSLQRTSPWVP